MKAYSHIVIIFTCCICMYTAVEIMPQLKKNILIFGYGINFKYKGMSAHSFDRFYVVTIFISPSFSDLNFLPTDFDERCNNLNEDLVHNYNTKEYMSNLELHCRKIVPFISFL